MSTIKITIENKDINQEKINKLVDMVGFSIGKHFPDSNAELDTSRVQQGIMYIHLPAVERSAWGVTMYEWCVTLEDAALDRCEMDIEVDLRK